MYLRKILVAISLLGVCIGGYFVFNFYQIFFWSNTAFNNDSSYIYIDRDDTIDSLENQLLPLLKSVDRFLLAAKKKDIQQGFELGNTDCYLKWGTMK